LGSAGSRKCSSARNDFLQKNILYGEPRRPIQNRPGRRGVALQLGRCVPRLATYKSMSLAAAARRWVRRWVGVEGCVGRLARFREDETARPPRH
jgi:hypothetical protein